MAIKDFKDIVDRKGYLVESEDRKIFEKELTKASYGLGCDDMIEFILYDSSGNQLPQGEDGKLVRYVSVEDEDYKKYFINLPRNPYSNTMNDSDDYVVDLQQLIIDSGYNMGVFKTQITFLNRRIGSELPNDKVWIHEISPSRTEVRLLPLKNKAADKDLEKRYSVFTDEKYFRDDVIYNIREYVDSVKVQNIKDYITLIKGKESDGLKYIKLIQKEFKINNFDEFLLKLRDKWIESIKYYVDGYGWDVNNLNYGKPLNNRKECIELSLKELQNDLETSLLNIIDKFLFKRDIIKDNILTKEEQITLDAVKNILKTTTSGNIYESDIPDDVSGVVRGCTDPESKNYNPEATEDDGSCLYDEEEKNIYGCTDPNSLNYNPQANIDDGSCEYEEQVKIVKKKYYIWSDIGEINYTDKLGTVRNKKGIEFDSFTVVHQVGKVSFVGDVREYPKELRKKTTSLYRIKNLTIKNYIYSGGRPEEGNDFFNTEYRANTFTTGRYFYDEVEDDVFRGQSITVTYKDELGNLKTSREIPAGGEITLCAQEGTISEIMGMKIIKLGPCVTERDEPSDNTPRGGGSSGGSGGGGGTGSGRDEILFDENAGGTSDGINDPRGGTVGGGVGGSKVDKPVPNRNYK